MPRGFPTRPKAAKTTAAPKVEDADVSRAIAEVSDALADVQRNPIVPRAGVLGEVFYRQKNGTLAALPPTPTGALLTTAGGVPVWSRLNLASRYLMPPNAFPASVVSSRALADGATLCIYMGCAPATLDRATVTVCLRTTTQYLAGTGGTPWAEVGIATGRIVKFGNPILTPLAVVDATAELGAGSGPKQIDVTGVTIAAGTDWWAIVGNKIGTSGGQVAVVRSTGQGDELVIGTQGEAASHRPSTAGPATYTKDLSTEDSLWIAFLLP